MVMWNEREGETFLDVFETSDKNRSKRTCSIEIDEKQFSFINSMSINHYVSQKEGLHDFVTNDGIFTDEEGMYDIIAEKCDIHNFDSKLYYFCFRKGNIPDMQPDFSKSIKTRFDEKNDNVLLNPCLVSKPSVDEINGEYIHELQVGGIGEYHACENGVFLNSMLLPSPIRETKIKIDDTYHMIDASISNSLKKLNDHGYSTKFSCSGTHIDHYLEKNESLHLHEPYLYLHPLSKTTEKCIIDTLENSPIVDDINIEYKNGLFIRFLTYSYSDVTEKEYDRTIVRTFEQLADIITDSKCIHT